jgi:hypothetical protein
MVYRKTLESDWECSWNCGFQHPDIAEVAKQENEGYRNS